MANCRSCGYFIPDGAKKCVHCGDELWVPKFLKILPIRIIWKTIATLTSISTLVVAAIIGWQAFNLNAQTQINKKRFEIENIPVVRIGPISFNASPYIDMNGDESVFLSFVIPITNKHGFAENIRIVKKNLDLLRSKYNLNEESLQSSYTKKPFDLSFGETVYDNIHIDESPQNYAKFLTGEKTFTLEYEIQYTSFPEVTKYTFICHYKVEIKRGGLEILEQRTERKRE